jgi:cytochrome b subunit of formate dehydrogenase
MKKLFVTTILVVLALVIVSKAQSQTVQACLECHKDKSLTMTKNKKEVSIYVDYDHTLINSAHKKLVCVACHAGFDPDNMPHKEKITPVNCLSCHNKAMMKHTFHPNMIKASGMGGTLDVNCKNCHGTHEVISPKVEGSKFNEKNIVQACGNCHKEVKEKFTESAHGKAIAEGSTEAPNCLSCHQTQITKIIAGQDTTQLKLAQARVCQSCHLKKEQVADKTLLGRKFIESWEHSVHGAALLRGNSHAANCVNCHGNHQMNKSIVSSSQVNKMHIPETCAQCHSNIAKEFGGSIHAEAVKKGNKDAPVCTDCHGEHNILKHNDPNSPVAAKNVSKQVCGQCHASVKLAQKYGLSSDRFQTFSDSYHGLAMRSGSLEVANCASCHGSHGIKSPSDSTATVNKVNIVKTCGKCHPGANSRFTVGAVHASTEKKEDEPVLYWIANFYIGMIVLLVGAMFLHNAFDFTKKVRRKLQIQQGLIEESEAGHALYLRMSGNERLQHAALVLSFILLVITGFMLKYPDAWWVVGVRHLSDNVFTWRNWIHRISAVVMVAASLYHLGYISLTVRGRQLIKDLFPKVQDLRDMIRMIEFNIGTGKEKPKFARFGYIEKFEYWALVWGTILMAITGAILWFENASMGLLSKLGWDISRTIHFYEAVLATSAIIVWHFYFVIFNPDVYPMSLAWLTGKVSEKEMADEHPLELEKMRAEEQKREMNGASDGDASQTGRS